MFLDNMTIGYIIPKVSGYPRELCGKFLDNILYKGIIRKFSVFYPVGVDYPENVGIVNICAASDRGCDVVLAHQSAFSKLTETGWNVKACPEVLRNV
jgi:hypothetical protein